jgi:hypothetical protein
VHEREPVQERSTGSGYIADQLLCFQFQPFAVASPMSEQEGLLERLQDMLSVQPAPIDRTTVFRDTSHDELCKAFHYWLSQMQLLFGRPVNMTEFHGPLEQGADLVLAFVATDIKFGIQIKSYQDVQAQGFQSKLMSQITYSRKHDLSKLFVVICSDMTDPSQSSKTRVVLSELSQIGNYAIPVPPEKAVVVLECFRGNHHPVSYIRGTKQIAHALEGLARALSDDTHVADIKVNLESREQLSTDDYPVRTNISFKPGDSALDALDLIRIAKAGQPVTIPGEMIERLVILDKDGKRLVPEGAKVEWLKLIPEIAKLSPINLVTRDPSSGSSIRLDGIQFVRQKVVNEVLYLVSDDEPRPFELTLELDFSKHTANFDGKIDDQLADAKDALLFSRFMVGVLKSGGLEIRDRLNDGLLIPMDLSKTALSKDAYDSWLELLENLSLVQDLVKTRIKAPMSPTIWDLEASRKIRELLETGKTQLPFFRFDILCSKADLSRVVSNLREKGAILNMSVSVGEFEFSLCGQKLSVRGASAQVPCARPLEDLASLENRCGSLREDEKIAIALATCENTPATLRLKENADRSKHRPDRAAPG